MNRIGGGAVKKTGYLLIGGAILLAGALGSLSGHIKGQGSQAALAGEYTNTEELVKHAEVIVRGEVLKNPEPAVRKLSGDRQAAEMHFKVRIKDVLLNRTDRTIKKGEQIKLAQTLSSTVSGRTVDLESPDMPEGDYLLFLNGEKVKGETVYNNHSPRHLYKEKQGDYINAVKGTGINELKLDELRGYLDQQ